MAKLTILSLCALLLYAQPPTPPTSTPTLQVSHRARAVAPGEVVIVNVTTPQGLDVIGVDASWFGGRVRFYRIDPSQWQGLVAIDVAAKSGPQTLRLTARASDRRELERSYPITIEPRTFPARRLKVDAKFVDPPASELARIEAERKTNEAIFANPSPERLWNESFVVPVPGASTSSFGRRTILNGTPRGQHTGTDFQAATGTPVVAPNRGRIALAADQYFPGRTIIIDHGLGLYSYLAHLSSFTVEEGAIVERGQRVGLSGATGRVTGPHLHWTMRVGSARVDPLSLVTILKGDAPQ